MKKVSDSPKSACRAAARRGLTAVPGGRRMATAGLPTMTVPTKLGKRLLRGCGSSPIARPVSDKYDGATGFPPDEANRRAAMARHVASRFVGDKGSKTIGREGRIVVRIRLRRPAHEVRVLNRSSCVTRRLRRHRGAGPERASCGIDWRARARRGVEPVAPPRIPAELEQNGLSGSANRGLTSRLSWTSVAADGRGSGSGITTWRHGGSKADGRGPVTLLE